MSNDTSNSPGVDLDRAIDRVVREMVQVEPRPGLRGRVLARIAKPTPRVIFFPRFAFGAAALAALMLIALVVRRDPAAPVTVAVARPVAPPPTAASGGTQARPDATAVPPATPSRGAPVVASKRGPTSEPIRMPTVTNVFGPRDNRAAAANVPGPRDVSGPVTDPSVRAPIEVPPPAIPPMSGDARSGLQANPLPAAAGRRPSINIELTISDQAGSSEPVKKVVTLIVPDRQSGSVRNGGIVMTAPVGSTVLPAERRTGILNVDATPSVTPEGAILVSLMLEYGPPTDADGIRGRPHLNERMSVVLESGKAVVISEASDAGSNRRVTVELKATILRPRP